MRRGAHDMLTARRVREQLHQPLMSVHVDDRRHCVAGYFLPCHSSSPASRAEVSVPTIDVGHHCFAATGLMPRAVQSRTIDPTDSPCSSTRMAASRIASA